MALAIDMDRTLVWDRQQTQLVTKTRVAVRLLGNRGSIFAEQGPLYVDTPQELLEAVQLLKSRLIRSLPSME
jgi:hypothetical protein